MRPRNIISVVDNIGGGRILSSAGTKNLFAGIGAGTANVGGFGNSFFGANAGQLTNARDNSFFGADAGAQNTGLANSFFGSAAGPVNTSGFGNSFFGRVSGVANTTGNSNAFFGIAAGAANMTGSFNTMIGNEADLTAVNLTNATAIGSRSRVSQSNSLVLGSINGQGGATADTNVGIGTTAPSQRLHVVGNGLFTENLTVNGTLTAPNFALPAGSGNYIQNQSGGPQASSNFNISGNGRIGGNLGIGTTSPTNELTIGVPETTNVVGKVGIFGTAGFNIVLRETTNDVEGFLGINSGSGLFLGTATSTALGLRTNGSTRLNIEPTGNVGIGTTSPADLLDVDGDIRIGTTGTNGCIKQNAGTGILGTCSSDIRFKQNITPFPNLLDQLTKLRPSYFFWRAAEFPQKHFGTEQTYGLIAQEVEQVMPELVTQDEQGYKQVDYSKLPLLTIQAVKEQQEKIQQQQVQIEQLLKANMETQRINKGLLDRLTLLERQVNARQKSVVRKN